MTTAIEEVRALLALFAKSPWRDLHVRTGDWEIFFAQPDGAANPIVTRAGSADMAVTIDAPHLGLFFSQVEAGTPVTAGSVIGEIEVLGERETIVADRAGKVTAVLVVDGALVEFDMPLIRLAA